MLPFLKKLQEGSASTPVEKVKRDPDDAGAEEGEFDSLTVAAGEIIDAVHAKDKEALTSALRAFRDLDCPPTTEGPHNG